MERNINLNTTDEWENIVNTNAMQRAFVREAEQKRWSRQLLLSACMMAVSCIAILVLGMTGAVAGWLTTVMAIGCMVASSFLLGRYMEAKKR